MAPVHFVDGVLVGIIHWDKTVFQVFEDAHQIKIRLIYKADWV